MAQRAHVVSVNVAKARTFEVAADAGGAKRKFRSAILKAPIERRALLREVGIDGDQQADRRYHGGPEKAIYLYSFEHYAIWQRALKSVELPPGTFGENLTIAGFERGLEHELHVGDVLQIGTAARVQLTTPRQPCWKLETRMGLKGFARAFLESGRLGMYARVVAEGEIGAGDEVSVVERSPNAATIAELIRALYVEDRAAAARVLADARLDPRMRARLARARPRDGGDEACPGMSHRDASRPAR